jgi:tetratricopeptide (TPR) repeat protein
LAEPSWRTTCRHAAVRRVLTYRWFEARALSTLFLLALMPLSVATCQSSETKALLAAKQALADGRALLPAPAGTTRLREARLLFKQAGDKSGEAESLFWLGVGEQKAKHLPEALAALQEAGELHVAQTDGFYDEVTAARTIADIQLELGRLQEAWTSYQQARVLAQKQGSEWNEAFANAGLGRVESRLGRKQESAGRFEKARASMQKQDHLWAEGSVLSSWAEEDVRAGDLRAARDHYDQALKCHERSLAQAGAQPDATKLKAVERSRLSAAQVSYAVGKLEVSSGDHTAARAAAARGLELMQGMPTAAEQDEAGRVHDFAPAQNRELIANLKALQVEAQQGGSAAPTPPP